MRLAAHLLILILSKYKFSNHFLSLCTYSRLRMLSIRCFELATECMYLQTDGPSEPHMFHLPRSIARCLRVPTLDAFVNSYGLQLMPVVSPMPGPSSTSDAAPAYLGPLHVPMAGTGPARGHRPVSAPRPSPTTSVIHRVPRSSRNQGPTSANQCAFEFCPSHSQGLPGSSAVPDPSRPRPYPMYGTPAGYENWEVPEEVVAYSETRSSIEGPSVDLSSLNPGSVDSCNDGSVLTPDYMSQPSRLQ